MNGHQHVLRLEHGGHHADKEVLGRNTPTPVWTRKLQLRVERYNDGWPIGRGVCVRQRATDGATISHLRSAIRLAAS